MEVAILGAGLLGTCLALELANRGISVHLYDREEACITQAGVRNEGKLHLGFVYGADLSFQTAEKMLTGAFSFYPLLKRWIGDEIDSLSVSSPFIYLLEKESLLSEGEVDHYFARLERKILEISTIDYPGGALQKVKKLSVGEIKKGFKAERITAAYQTPERSVDSQHLASLLRAAVERSERIQFYPRSEIKEVSIYENRVKIGYISEKIQREKSYDSVANALWDGRLALDEQVGLVEKSPWNYRLKHAIFFKAKELLDLPSITIIQGSYGDVVNYGNGCFYFSWYPICQQGFVRNQIAPPEWNRNLSREAGEELAIDSIRLLSRYIPSLEKINKGQFQDLSVKGGIIYACGETDVNDPKSGLHCRYQPAIRSRGNYYSINPGKFTLCPYFASEAARQICSASLPSLSVV